MSRNPDDLVRRLAAGLRAAELYAPQHPLVQRSVTALAAACTAHLADAPSLVVGFIGDDVVVNDTRLGKGSASLTGFVRGLRDREIEKITFHRGVTTEEIQSFLSELADRRSRAPLADRLASRGVKRVVIGKALRRGHAAGCDGDRGGAPRLQHRRRVGRVAVAAGEGRRQARSRERRGRSSTASRTSSRRTARR